MFFRFLSDYFPSIHDVDAALHRVAAGAVEGIDSLTPPAPSPRGEGEIGWRLRPTPLPEADGILNPALGDCAGAEAEAVGQTAVGVELVGDAEGEELVEAVLRRYNVCINKPKNFLSFTYIICIKRCL